MRDGNMEGIPFLSKRLVKIEREVISSKNREGF